MSGEKGRELWNVPELLELVLCFSTTQTITRACQSNKQGRAVVLGSLKLQKALFLVPNFDTSWLRIEWENVQGPAQHDRNGVPFNEAAVSTLRIAPHALGPGSRPDYMVVQPHPFLDLEPKWDVEVHDSSLFHLADSKKLLSLSDGRWLEMFITQPPCRGLEITTEAYSGDEAEDKDLMSSLTSSLSSGSSNYITLADIRDCLRTFMETCYHHRQCHQLQASGNLAMKGVHDHYDDCHAVGNAVPKMEHDRVMQQLASLDWSSMKPEEMFEETGVRAMKTRVKISGIAAWDCEYVRSAIYAESRGGDAHSARAARCEGFRR